MEKLSHKFIYYRPHKAGVAHQCPSSLLKPEEFSIRQVAGVRADLGSAAHDVFENLISQNKDVTDDAVIEYSAKHNVDAEGFNGLGWRIFKLQKQYRKLLEKGFLENPISEERWEVQFPNGYGFSCIPDLYEIHSEWAVIVELKMGEVDTGWNMQARDYGVAMMRKFAHHGIKKVYCIVFAPVADYYDVKSYTAEELSVIENEICEHIDQAGQKYLVGEHCPYCDVLLNCPAIKRKIDPISQNIIDIKRKGVMITGAEVEKWRPVVKSMERICSAYKEAELVLLQSLGSIRINKDSELYLADQYKKKLNVGKAIGIACDTFKVKKADFVSRLSMSNKDVEQLVGDVAPDGKKMAYKREFWEQVEEQDAVEKVLQPTRRIRKIQNKKELSNE